MELRPFLGGKASIRRSLGVLPGDTTSSAALAAYSRVHSEVEGLIARVKEQQLQGASLMKVDMFNIRLDTDRFPLSRREIAGIAGQVLLDVRDAVANQQLMSAEYSQSLFALAIKQKIKGISAISVADFAVLARPVLDSLGIDPSPADMGAIGETLLGYLPLMQADIAKLQQMDFSPPRLAEVVPPLPKRQASWRDLFDAWLRSTGGVLEQDGYGVSQGRQAPYLRTIAEFKQQISDATPAEVTVEDARRYLRWLQVDSGLSVRSQQGRLTCIRNLLRIGVRDGKIDTNVFTDVVLSTPAGIDDAQGYRPFTKPELIRIFTTLKEEKLPQRQIVPWILLCTGCRLSEALQLRTKDVQQTEAGTLFINWEHEPLAKPPMLLKTKTKNNRQCPVHPRLLTEGFSKLPKKKSGLLLPGEQKSVVAWSKWFERLLRALDIYEKRRTTLHSLRGTAKDLQREAGLTVDVRNALTGHSSRDVGESSYGRGLRFMPDTLHQELLKVDLEWLP